MLRALGLALAISISSPAIAQDGGLGDEIRAVHDRQENVGYRWVLRHKGQTVASDQAGYALIEHAIPINEDTRFSVMSVTKAFAGALLLKAAENGIVDLDATVGTYLSVYPEAGRAITLRQLANHTAGLPHLGHPDRRAIYAQRFDDATAALDAFKDLPPRDAPGASYGYASSHYNLLAAILEAASGKSFAVLLDELLLGPLDLDQTAPLDVQRPIPHLARGYSWVEIWTYSENDALQQVPTWDFSYNPGGGNMVSSPDDMAAFAEAVLLGDYFNPASRMLASQRVSDDGLSNWGWGWIHSEREDGRRVISISGATPGVQASIIVLPEEQLVFAMAANSWGKGSAGGELVLAAPQRMISAYLASLDD